MPFDGTETYRCGRSAGYRGLLCACLALLIAVVFVPHAGALDVKEIRFWSLGDITRVVIQFDGEFQYKWARLDNPPRVFFDLPGADLRLEGARVPGRVYTMDVSDHVLKQIRYAENSPGNARIVLDLATDCDLKSSQLANPPRLIVELRSKQAIRTPIEMSRTGSVGGANTPPARASAQPPGSSATALAVKPAVETTAKSAKPAPSAESAIKPAETQVASSNTVAARTRPSEVATSRSEPVPEPVMAAAETPRPSRGDVQPAAPAGARPTPVSSVDSPAAEPEEREVALAKPAARTASGQQSLVRALGLKLGRIVIDPGHGGKDQGTSAGDGFHEKDIVLDIAKRLRSLIESELGAEVVLTREEDVFLSLEERTALANQHRADLFVSLHANSSPFKLASGSETFYLNFTSSREAMDIAARENASSTKSIADLQDIVKKIALKDKRDESRDLAAKVQASLFKAQRAQGTAKKNRGVKAAPFIVLIGADMPSILVEIGFLSNAKERTALGKDDYRQSLAQGLYEGLKSYIRSLSHFETRERAAREE